MTTPNDKKSEPNTEQSVGNVAKLIRVRVPLQYDFNSTNIGQVGEKAPGPNKGRHIKLKDPRRKGIEKEKAQKAKAQKARVLSGAKAKKTWAKHLALIRTSPEAVARNTERTGKKFVEALLLFCSPFVNPHAKERLLALVNEVVENGFELSALIDPNYVVKNLFLFQRHRDPESIDGAMRDLIGKIKALIPGSELFLGGPPIFNGPLGPKGENDALTAYIAAVAIHQDIDNDKFLKLVLADLSRMMGVLRANDVKKILDDFLMKINRKEFLLRTGLEPRQGRMNFERADCTPKAIIVHESREAAANRADWTEYDFGRAWHSDIFYNTAGNVPEEAEYPPPWAANERRRHQEFIWGERQRRREIIRALAKEEHDRQVAVNRALAKKSAKGVADGAWFH